MNFLDLIIGIPILLMAIGGFRRGLIKEVAALAALILGIYFAIYFSDVTAKFLIEHFNIGHRYVFIVAFIITFIGVVLVVSLIGRLLNKVASLAMLGPVNKILGLVFGLLKGIVIMSVLIMLFNMIDTRASILRLETKEESLLYGPVGQVAPLILMNIQNIDFDDPSWKDYNNKVKNVSLDEIV